MTSFHDGKVPHSKCPNFFPVYKNFTQGENCWWFCNVLNRRLKNLQLVTVTRTRLNKNLPLVSTLHIEWHIPHSPLVMENIILLSGLASQNKNHKISPACRVNPNVININVPTHLTITPSAKHEIPPTTPKQIITNPTFSMPKLHDM